MMRRHSAHWVVGALLAVSGCGPAAHAPGKRANSTEQTWTVWGSTADGSLRTIWLTCSQSQCRARAEHDGAYLLWADELWQLIPERAEYPSFDCGQVEAVSGDPERVKAVGSVSVAGLGVRGLHAKQRHTLVATTLEDARATRSYPAEYRQAVTPLGSLGPWLLVEVGSAGLFCGAAHDNAGSSFLLWNLEQAAVRPLSALIGADEQPSLAAHEQAQATARLARKLTEQGEPLEPSAVELSALFPSIAHGAVQLDLVYTAPTCRACSDREWSDYTVAARVPLISQLASLEPYRTLPPPLARFTASHPDLKVRGVGGSRAGAAVVEGLFSAFSGSAD